MTTIAHITSVHRSGDNRIRFKQCRSLSECGYDVVLVATDAASADAGDNVRVVSVPKTRSRLLRMFISTFRVCRAALKEKPALMHFHDPELLPWVQLFRLMGRRVIYDMHENVPKAILDKHWIPAVLRKPISLAVALIERVLLWRVPVVFAEVSYADHYPRVHDSEIVQNFPDLSRILTIREPKHETFSLVYMGGISEVRGSAVMVEAFERLKRAGHDIELHLIGRGSLPERPASAPPLDGITMHGFLPAEEGFRIVSRCHVGLAVLMPIPNYVRSYPTKMFEYMAIGLPIVVSGFPLYREAMGDSDCGYPVDPESVDEVVSALEALIENPDEAARMGERGRAHVQAHYAWENEFAHLLRLYERLIGPLQAEA